MACSFRRRSRRDRERVRGGDRVGPGAVQDEHLLFSRLPGVLYGDPDAADLARSGGGAPAAGVAGERETGDVVGDDPPGSGGPRAVLREVECIRRFLLEQAVDQRHDLLQPRPHRLRVSGVRVSVRSPLVLLSLPLGLSRLVLGFLLVVLSVVRGELLLIAVPVVHVVVVSGLAQRAAAGRQVVVGHLGRNVDVVVGAGAVVVVGAAHADRHLPSIVPADDRPAPGEVAVGARPPEESGGSGVLPPGDAVALLAHRLVETVTGSVRPVHGAASIGVSRAYVSRVIGIARVVGPSVAVSHLAVDAFRANRASAVRRAAAVGVDNVARVRAARIVAGRRRAGRRIVRGRLRLRARRRNAGSRRRRGHLSGRQSRAVLLRRSERGGRTAVPVENVVGRSVIVRDHVWPGRRASDLRRARGRRVCVDGCDDLVPSRGDVAHRDRPAQFRDHLLDLRVALLAGCEHRQRPGAHGPLPDHGDPGRDDERRDRERRQEFDEREGAVSMLWRAMQLRKCIAGNRRRR